MWNCHVNDHHTNMHVNDHHTNMHVNDHHTNINNTNKMWNCHVNDHHTNINNTNKMWNCDVNDHHTNINNTNKMWNCHVNDHHTNINNTNKIVDVKVSNTYSLLIYGLCLWCSTPLSIFSAISWRSVLLVKETGVRGENHRSVAIYWQTLSHNVGSSTSRHKRYSK